MSCNDNIGLSRKQRVFVCVEDVCGTLQFPTPSTDFISPVGNASMNQMPTFVDSGELRNTLDVLAQFQNATGPATWSIPMFLRMTGTVGTTQYPQGHALFQALQGGVKAATTASLNGGILAAGEIIKVDGISNGQLPEVGVITIGSEKIYYGTLTQAYSSATATLASLTRAYNSTSAADATDNADVTLSSIFYEQDTSSPSVSIWIEDDHLVRGLSGATVNNCTINVNNEGAVQFAFSGEGMEMVWAGTSALAATAASGDLTITVDDGEIFKAGAFIQNSTKVNNRNAAGYEIASVSGNVLTLSNAIAGATSWATDDVIKGYLGTETVIGTVVESRLSDVYIDGVSTKVRGMDMTISVPKQYLTDELGTSYPEDFVEDVRNITSSLNLYNRKSDTQYFTQGFAGTQKEIILNLGDTQGYIMDLVGKKVQIQVPEISADGPATAMAISLRYLGTDSEDSLQLVCR